MFSFSKKIVSVFFFSVLASQQVFAEGGVSLSATRIIYPIGQKQTNISVRNTSHTERFLVQSWVEDASGKKTSDFISTPPLYVSNPQTDNSLRLMYAGKELPKDRETLFYLVSKAIPAIEKSQNTGESRLILSAATRIKLFMRPAELKMSQEEAAKKLTFTQQGDGISVKNTSPYYITLTDLKSGGKALNTSVMVSPFSTQVITLSLNGAKDLTYKTINDYGGFSEERKISY